MPPPQLPGRQVLRGAFFLHFLSMSVLSGILGICLSGLPLLAVVAGAWQEERRTTSFIAIVGLALILVSVLAATAARARTIVDDQGVKVVRPWASHSVAWPEVTTVEVERSPTRWWSLNARVGDAVVTLYRHPQYDVPRRALPGSRLFFAAEESSLSLRRKDDEEMPKAFRHACSVIAHSMHAHAE